jgi:Cohesin domain
MVPVKLDVSNGVNQANLVLSYDTSRLQLVDVQACSLTQPAEGFTISTDTNPQAGIVVVNASSAQPLSGQGAGSLAVLVFQVRAGAPAGTAFVNLDASVPASASAILGAQWTQLSGVDGQGDPAVFVLSPVTIYAPGSPDDGLVNVLPA